MVLFSVWNIRRKLQRSDDSPNSRLSVKIGSVQYYRIMNRKSVKIWKNSYCWKLKRMWQYVRAKFRNVTKDIPFLVVQLLLGEQAGSGKRGWKHRAIFTDKPSHAQWGLQYLVCLSVYPSVTFFCHHTQQTGSDTNGFSATLALFHFHVHTLFIRITR